MKYHAQTFRAPGFRPSEIAVKTGAGFFLKYLFVSALVFPLFWTSAVAARPNNASHVITAGKKDNQGGPQDFFDKTGRHPTDEIYNVNDWFADDFGNETACEQINWHVGNPTITFEFSEPVTINQIGIDFSLDKTKRAIHPFTLAIDNTDFTVSPNAICAAGPGMLFFNGDWTGTTLTVDLTGCSPSRFTFIDKVVLNRVSPVPEPSVIGLVICAFGLLLLRMRSVRRN